jgi:hypothetical protein
MGTEQNTAPYTFTWDTRASNNGNYSLTASARDAVGNSTTSSAVQVIVSNVVTNTVGTGTSSGGGGGGGGNNSKPSSPLNAITPGTQPTNSAPTTSTPSTGGGGSSYNFGTTTLRNGSKGAAVKELQRFLNTTLNLGLVIDGKLGPKTIAVIKKWQKAHGLVVDGLIGNKTKAMMNASVR